MHHFLRYFSILKEKGGERRQSAMKGGNATCKCCNFAVDNGNVNVNGNENVNVNVNVNGNGNGNENVNGMFTV
jgi:hypothetical protein